MLKRLALSIEGHKEVPTTKSKNIKIVVLNTLGTLHIKNEIEPYL